MKIFSIISTITEISLSKGTNLDEFHFNQTYTSFHNKEIGYSETRNLQENTYITNSYCNRHNSNCTEINKYFYNFQLIKTLKHPFSIISLVELSNGMLASRSLDDKILIWDPSNNFELIKTLQHSPSVTSMVELSNGMLASGGNDKTIRIWDTSNNIQLIRTLPRHYYDTLSLLQLSNGMFASVSIDAIIRIWDPSDNFQLIKTLYGDTWGSHSVLQLSNGMLALFGGYLEDNTIKIWDPSNNFQLIKTLRSTSSITSLIQLSNGMLASAYNDKPIKIWNPGNNFQLIKTLTGHTNYITILLQLSNAMLASVGGENDKTINIWDQSNNSQLIYTLKEDYDISSLIQLSNGMSASASNGDIIKIYDASNNFQLINIFREHYDVSFLLQLSNGMLATVSREISIKIWKIFGENFYSSSMISYYNEFMKCKACFPKECLKFNNVNEYISNGINHGNYFQRIKMNECLETIILSSYFKPFQIFLNNRLEELFRSKSYFPCFTNSSMELTQTTRNSSVFFKIARSNSNVLSFEFVRWNSLNETVCYNSNDYQTIAYFELEDVSSLEQREIFVDYFIERYFKNNRITNDQNQISDLLDFNFDNSEDWEKNFIYVYMIQANVSYRNSLNIKNLCGYYDYTKLNETNFTCERNPDYKPSKKSSLPFLPQKSLFGFSFIGNYEAARIIGYVFLVIIGILGSIAAIIFPFKA